MKVKNLIEAEFLINERMARNITQAEFAKLIGFKSAQIIYSLEAGRILLPTKKLKRVAKGLGLSLDALIALKVRSYEFQLRQDLSSPRKGGKSK